jgi:hypothetical protein
MTGWIGMLTSCESHPSSTYLFFFLLRTLFKGRYTQVIWQIAIGSRLQLQYLVKFAFGMDFLSFGSWPVLDTLEISMCSTQRRRGSKVSQPFRPTLATKPTSSRLTDRVCCHRSRTPFFTPSPVSVSFPSQRSLGFDQSLLTTSATDFAQDMDMD